METSGFDMFEAQNFSVEANTAHQERETEGVDLYHITGWDGPVNLDPGESFILNPGKQNAQGLGVYFSEEKPRFTAAEGTNGNPQAVIHIKGGLQSEGWYRSKAVFSIKYGYPRTRHTQSQRIKLIIKDKDLMETEQGQVPILHCNYEMLPEQIN